MRVAFFLLAILSVACQVEKVDPTASPSVLLQVRVQSSLGDALKDVPLEADMRSPKTGAKKLQLSMSDEEGIAEIRIPPHTSLSLRAECPSGYTGSSLSRRFSDVMLRASPKWTLALICVPDEVPTTVAVLGPLCTELIVSLDGVTLGTTKGGVLHRVVTLVNEGAGELSVRAVNEDCLVKNPSRSFELRRPYPSIWAHFTAKEKKRPKRRVSTRRKAEAARPYRL